MGVTFEPMDNFVIRGYCDREGFDRSDVHSITGDPIVSGSDNVLGANEATKSIAIFYDNDKFSFGYERMTKKNNLNVKRDNYTLSSYYGSYSCANNLTFFVRADDSNLGIEDVNQYYWDGIDYAVIGVEKTLAEGVKVAVNYKNKHHSRDSDLLLYDPVEEENFVLLWRDQWHSLPGR